MLLCHGGLALCLLVKLIDHETKMLHEGKARLNHVKRDPRQVDRADRGGDDRRRVDQQHHAEYEP
jgi:hypothetical protein